MTRHTDRIDRLAVRWRVDADPGAAGHARLAALAGSLVEDGLAGGFSTDADRDRLVCVRRVRVPDTRMRWDRDDAELAAQWGRIAGQAVSAALIDAGADVVRYRTIAHARQDLVTSVLRADRDRVWAWRLLALWPAGGSSAGAVAAPAAEVLAAVLLTAAREEPHTAAGLVTVVAAAGLLPNLLEVVPAAALVVLAREAWRCVTGSVPEPPPHLGAPRETAPASTAVARTVMSRSAIAGALRAAPDDLDLAAALAAFAVLEVDPGLARGPSAGQLLAEIADRIAGTRTAWRDRPTGKVADRHDRHDRQDQHDPQDQQGRQDHRYRDDRHDQQERQHTATPDPPCRPPGPSAPFRLEDAHRSFPSPPGTARTPVPVSPVASSRESPPSVVGVAQVWRTGWGGLLFLLPLVDGTGLPDLIATEPGRFGAELRPVLHELGRRICRRAAPAVGLAEATDPAVLAFAGLPPDAAPPRTPPRTDALESFIDDLVADLRARLRPDPPAGDQALLAAVCRRNAEIEADPGWIDVLLDLDQVDVDIRRAGLDLDPGYLPWFGCVVRYRYG
jgi:hypothetical protein